MNKKEKELMFLISDTLKFAIEIQDDMTQLNIKMEQIRDGKEKIEKYIKEMEAENNV